MAQYEKGDYVKFEMTHEQSGEREWVWLSVDNSSDEQQVVFGQLDSEPVVATDVKRGQHLAVSYALVREHKRASDFQTE